MTPEGKIYAENVYRGNMSPLRDEKPIFGLILSKNNTGMAALRAGRPAGNKTLHNNNHSIIYILEL